MGNKRLGTSERIIFKVPVHLIKDKAVNMAIDEMRRQIEKIANQFEEPDVLQRNQSTDQDVFTIHRFTAQTFLKRMPITPEVSIGSVVYFETDRANLASIDSVEKIPRGLVISKYQSDLYNIILRGPGKIKVVGGPLSKNSDLWLSSTDGCATGLRPEAGSGYDICLGWIDEEMTTSQGIMQCYFIPELRPHSFAL